MEHMGNAEPQETARHTMAVELEKPWFSSCRSSATPRVSFLNPSHLDVFIVIGVLMFQADLCRWGHNAQITLYLEQHLHDPHMPVEDVLSLM